MKSFFSQFKCPMAPDMAARDEGMPGQGTFVTDRGHFPGWGKLQDTKGG